MTANDILDYLVPKFDELIENAPVDFMGTGDSIKNANREERKWCEQVSNFRTELISLLGGDLDEYKETNIGRL